MLVYVAGGTRQFLRKQVLVWLDRICSPKIVLQNLSAMVNLSVRKVDRNRKASHATRSEFWKRFGGKMTMVMLGLIVRLLTFFILLSILLLCFSLPGFSIVCQFEKQTDEYAVHLVSAFHNCRVLPTKRAPIPNATPTILHSQHLCHAD